MTETSSPLPGIAGALTSMPRIDNREAWLRLSPVTRWLIMVRAPVLLMTLGSLIVALLLALAQGPANVLSLFLLAVGLLAAHATNNLLNDLTDVKRGIDHAGYFRRQYGVHVLAQQFVSLPMYLLVTVATAGLALAAGLSLIYLHGEHVVYLMLAGGFFVLFYTWPLKTLALGEAVVWVVWGPLMVLASVSLLGGRIGAIEWLVASLYGIGPTLVIMGKHLDKYRQDRELGVGTLPVRLGEATTRRVCLSLLGVQLLFVVSLGFLMPWMWLLLILVPLAVPLAKALRAPVPASRPAQFPASVWPLWFSAITFQFVRVQMGVIGAVLIVVLVQSRLFGTG